MKQAVKKIKIRKKVCNTIVRATVRSMDRIERLVWRIVFDDINRIGLKRYIEKKIEKSPVLTAKKYGSRTMTNIQTMS